MTEDTGGSHTPPSLSSETVGACGTRQGHARRLERAGDGGDNAVVLRCFFRTQLNLQTCEKVLYLFVTSESSISLEALLHP